MLCPVFTLGGSTKNISSVDSPAATRPHLAFMAGSHSSRVRLAAYNALKDEPGFLIIDPQQRVRVSASFVNKHDIPLPLNNHALVFAAPTHMPSQA